MPTGFYVSSAQSYDHSLRKVAGFQLADNLQHFGTTKANEVLKRGSITSIDSNGLFVAGLSVPSAIAMWTETATTDHDSRHDFGGMHQAEMSAFLATGGFEIHTTEFVAGSYSLNGLLGAATSTDAGKVTGIALGAGGLVPLAATVVGIVSKVPYTDEYGASVIGIWPVYQPGRVV